jgi:hypothetical protein
LNPPLAALQPQDHQGGFEGVESHFGHHPVAQQAHLQAPRTLRVGLAVLANDGQHPVGCGAVHGQGGQCAAIAAPCERLFGSPALHIKTLATHRQQAAAIKRFPVHMVVDHHGRAEHNHNGGHMPFHASKPCKRAFERPKRSGFCSAKETIKDKRKVISKIKGCFVTVWS